MTFKFSVVMAAYNAEKYIGESLDSIIRQSIGFKDHIQIIIVNDASEDNTRSICESYVEKYPNNIKLINNETNKGPAYTRNRGLSQVEGEYVNFLDSDDYISKNTFEKVNEFLKTYKNVDFVSIPIHLFGYKRGEHPLNFKFKNNPIVNLQEIPNAIQLSAASSFFRYSKIEGKKFNENLKVSEDALLINQLLLKNPTYGLLPDCEYHYRKNDNSNSLITDSANNKSYFTSRVDNYFFRLIEDSLSLYDEVPEFIQNVIMYDLQWILEIKDLSVLLNEEEMKELYEKIFSLLFYIGDEVILSQRSIPSMLKAHIVLLKYFKWDYLETKTFNIHDIDERFLKNEKNLVPRMDKEDLSKLIDHLALNTVYIDNFVFKKPKELYISGILTSLFNKEINIKAAISDDDNKNATEEIIDSNKLDFPQRDNFSLNFNYGFNHNFEFKIPIKYENTKISFRTDLEDFNQVCSNLGIEINDEDSKDFLTKNLIIDYNLTSRLTSTSKYKMSKDYISFDKKRYILVSKRTPFKFISNELTTLLDIFKQKSEGWRTGLVLRILYLIAYPFFRNKRIWILSDLPYSADDNGIQLFKFINKINNLGSEEYAKFIEDLDLSISSKGNGTDLRKIKVYFTLEKSSNHYNNIMSLENEYIASSNKEKIKKLLGFDNPSKEYEEIEKIGPILPYKSLKHRLYALYAELIVSSHPDNNIIYPFWGNYPHLAGLVKSKTAFLQHGVIKDDISSWLNSYDKNLDMFLTSSESERQSVLDNDYGYSEDVVKVLGLPRFDYLEALEDKREIIIMPTWRRQYHGFKDDAFMGSSFFKRFNRLLNDDVLLSYLEENNYKLVFKPHPNLNKFLKLFDKDDRVDFDLNDLNNEYDGYTSRRYNDIFNHSSLMITDFSSVFFDFAYIKKPLIYYHYDDDDYHFDSENGYFKYDSMGFGPVVNDHDELVNAIMNYVDSNCQMEEFFKERVEDFFKYNDRNNCKRVYKELVELDKYY